jgi:glycosyltransferase involved in cell wall biosynthesis
MDDRPPYAVLVPYYSNIEYLREALDSVVAQSVDHWWCAVVDDSPDGAAGPVVDEFAEPRFSYVRNPVRLGVAGNFNRCFEIAIQRGAELVVILHADDRLEPMYVEAIVAVHDRMAEAVCIAPRVQVIDATGREYLPLPDRVKSWLWPRHDDRLVGELGLRRLLRGQFFYCPAVSYRMAKLDVPAWDEQWGQVMDLMLYGRLLLDGGMIGLESERLYRYRRHAASQTQINTGTLARTVEETAAARALARRAAKKGWKRATRAGRLRLTIRLQSVMQAALALRHGRVVVARQAMSLALAFDAAGHGTDRTRNAH